ncbi:MAG: hypothetical protein M0C28_31080 [Candidatus Moduliflexus flocculans]|nr:hypothetical protein [Candidatus Moduliflexus flocculans]
MGFRPFVLDIACALIRRVWLEGVGLAGAAAGTDHRTRPQPDWLAAVLRLGVRAELEFGAVQRSRGQPTRRDRGCLEPALLALRSMDLSQLQLPPGPSSPAERAVGLSAEARAADRRSNRRFGRSTFVCGWGPDPPLPGPGRSL